MASVSSIPTRRLALAGLGVAALATTTSPAHATSIAAPFATAVAPGPTLVAGARPIPVDVVVGPSGTWQRMDIGITDQLSNIGPVQPLVTAALTADPARADHWTGTLRWSPAPGTYYWYVVGGSSTPGAVVVEGNRHRLRVVAPLDAAAARESARRRAALRGWPATRLTCTPTAAGADARRFRCVVRFHDTHRTITVRQRQDATLVVTSA
jgi:hypothetical protein